MPDVIPYFMVKPSVLVESHDAVPVVVELQCMSNGVDATPEQDENTTETFCGTYTNYKPEVWTITITVVQSFGTDGLWTLMRPLVGTLVDYTITPDSREPVSVDNPALIGVALVKAFSFVSGSVGEASEFDLVLAGQGIPTSSVTPAAAQAQAAPEPEPEPQPA